MAKNIIICSDGTGNSGGKGNGTNVWRTFEAVSRSSASQAQVAFYDDGVGTESFKPFKIMGGALGWGLSRNVRQLYSEICRIYEPGDRIFYFGFSRGAFTVRTLMYWILDVGLVHPKCAEDEKELQDLVEQSYEVLRGQFQAIPQKLLFGKSVQKRRRNALEPSLRRLDDEQRQALAHFIGVWDTVDAVGFPIPFVADIWNTLIYRFKFPDRDLHPDVRCACHALAIDDERHTFHPLLWNRPEAREGQELQQVWFSGMHSNVGGGYPQDGLSYIPLVWMLDAAKERGLVLTEGLEQLYRERANAMEKMYNSRSGPAMYYRFKPRSVSGLASESAENVVVHPSVIDRTKAAPGGYVPRQIPVEHTVWSDGKAKDCEQFSPALSEIAEAERLRLGSVWDTDQISSGMDRIRISLQWFIVIFTIFFAASAIGAGLFEDKWIVKQIGPWLAATFPGTDWQAWAVQFGVLLVVTFIAAVLAEKVSHRQRSAFWTRVLRKCQESRKEDDSADSKAAA